MIDAIDWALLEIVQKDGRISVVDLAERVGLSKTPCHKRLRRLERDGLIRGYIADIDSEKVGIGYLVFVQVKLEATTTARLEEFNRMVRTVPEITSCHMLSGGYDYLLKIRTRDMASYRELLGEVIAQLPGVAQTATFPVMEEVKDATDFMSAVPKPHNG